MDVSITNKISIFDKIDWMKSKLISAVSPSWISIDDESLFILVFIFLFILVSLVFGQGDYKWDDRFDALGMDAGVYVVAVDGNDLYAGGDFSTAGGVSASYVAMWDGSSWSALDSGVDNKVWAIAVDSKDIYFGGEFSTAGGVSASYVAMWDGSSWSALDSGVDNKVWAIAVDGGNIYVGGEFTSAGGISANRIARWDGSSWSALGSGVDGTVRALTVSGGEIYVGGEFTTAGGISVNYVAKWNGSSWSALDGGMGDKVWALAAYGGEVYVGGEFTTAGGISANRIARWDGTNWSAIGSGVNSKVLALDTAGEVLYAAGEFTTAGGNSANYIAKWFAGEWSNLGSGLSSKAWAVDISTDEQALYVGGEFTTAGGKNSNYFGRWLESLSLTWTGNINSNWSTAGNWDPASIPTETDDVEIPGVINNPVISSNATCRDILIGNGGFLTISNARNLDIKGNLNLGDGNGIDDGILTFVGNASLMLRGNYTKKDRSRINSNGATITFTGNLDQLIETGGTGSEDAFGNIVVDKSGSTVSLGDDVLMNVDFTIIAGTFDVAGNDMSVSGNWNNNGTFLSGTRTVTFNASAGGPMTISGGSSAFHNLVILSPQSYQLGFNLEVNGDLLILIGTLNANGFDINLAGDWTNTGSFTPGTGTVTFDGAAGQDITSGGVGAGKAFGHFTVDKSGGAAKLINVLEVNGDLTVANGTLDFNDMDVNLAGSFNNAGSLNKVATFTLDATFGGPYGLNTGSSALENVVLDASGIIYQLIGNSTIEGNLTINAGKLDLNGFELTFGDTSSDAISLNDEFEIDGGSTLSMFNGSSLAVNLGGEVIVVGSDGNQATVTEQSTSGNYNFTVGSGGTIQARYALFEYMSSAGITVQDGATIDAVNNFGNVDFDHGQSGGTMLWVGDITGSDQKLTINNTSFLTNPGGGASNVTKTASTDTLLFFKAHGFFAGEAFENDPFNLIEWASAFITKRWTGSTNQFWSTGGNWNPNGVPADSENVVIDGNVTNTPEVSSNAQCNDIKIENGGFLLVNSGRSLDLNGDLTIGGSDAKDDGILTLSGNASLSIAGDYTKRDQSVLNSNSSTVTFDGGDDQQIYTGGVMADDEFHHIVVNKASGTVFLNESMCLTGNFNLNTGIFNANVSDMTVAGNWNNAGTFYPGSGTVTLNASSAGPFTISAQSSTFNHLIINATGTYQQASNLDINGHLTISSGALDANGFDITLAGNWSNSATFSAGSGTVTIDGTADQSMASGGTGIGRLFNNLTLNKSGGKVQLLSSLDVDGNLTVTSGVLDINGQTVQFGDAATDLISISGSVNFNDFSELQMTGGSYIVINSGGLLSLVGSSLVNGPLLTRLSSGNYSMDVLNGGTIDPKNVTIEFTQGNGIHIQNGASIVASSKFDNSMFQNGTGTAYLTVENGQNLTISGVQFDSIAINRPTYNVVYSGSGSLTFSDYSGSMAGINFESDNGTGTRGNVRWYFTETEMEINNETRTFGNDFVLSTPDNLRDVTVSLIDNVLPIAPASVARYYTLQSQRSGLATVRLYYGDSELQGEIEQDLKVWQRRGGEWNILFGTVNTSQNYVEVSSGYSPQEGILDTLIISDALDDQGLPVALSSFTASVVGRHILLEWQTESEIENIGFIIKKSTSVDGIYQVISSYLFNEDLRGQFNSTTAHLYSYKDEEILEAVTYWYKLVDVDVNGMQTEHGPIGIHAILEIIPDSFELYPSFPNPFNPATTIRIDIPAGDGDFVEVELSIYNSLGQKVKTIHSGFLEPGSYDFRWNGLTGHGNKVATGVYFVILQTETFKKIQKLTLMK